MLQIISIVILCFFLNLTLHLRPVLASEECKDIVSKSAHVRLKKYLLCNYYEQILETTPTAKRKTTVWLSIAPKIILFDDDSGNMELHGRLYVSWVDKRLSWNPSEFDGVAKLRLRSWNIWVPDLSVQSDDNWKLNSFHTHPTPCIVEPSGWVDCNPEVDFKIRCQTDFTMWPFDRQNCTLVLASWSHTGDEIALNGQLVSALNLDTFYSNGEWEVTVSRVSFEDKKIAYFENGTSSILTMDFIMDRAHNHLSALFVSPAIIMMVLTLTTLWLDPRSIERVTLACLNPMIHLLCLQSLHWSLPHNGVTVPNILLYYADSFILATLALLLTFWSGMIQNTKTSAPKWIKSSTRLILRSKFGQIMLLNMLDPKAAAGIETDVDDTNNLIQSDSTEPAWGYIAILLSWISFISFFIAYIALYVILMPNSSMRPPVAQGKIPFFYFLF